MIDKLSKEYVTITVNIKSENFTKSYINSPTGRAAITAEQPPEIIAPVMAAWGDTPTVPDYVPDPILPPTIDQQIAALKSQIADSDYKIIKFAECQLAGLHAPYDIAALHTERQALRDKINNLETVPQ